MSLNSKEKPKKGKKKKEESEETIPDSLQNAPEPQQKEDVEPPRPISYQESKGDVPRPTRLPPRFKERFQPKQQSKPEQAQTKEQEPQAEAGEQSWATVQDCRPSNAG